MSAQVNAAAAERRRALGIPVYETDDEHEWRADGWCNCGAEKKPRPSRGRKVPNRTTARSNLDAIERNWDESGWNLR